MHAGPVKIHHTTSGLIALARAPQLDRTLHSFRRCAHQHYRLSSSLLVLPMFGAQPQMEHLSSSMFELMCQRQLRIPMPLLVLARCRQALAFLVSRTK
jgi:hypothetical protein